MENPKNYFELFISNPGFEHLGRNILRNLNKKTSLSLRVANHSCRDFVENPRFWLKKLTSKRSESMGLHKIWSNLINKVEQENPDLVQNIVFCLIKLTDNSQDRRELFPLNVFSLFGDLRLVQFIITNNMIKSLSKNSKYGNTLIHHAAGRGHTEIVKALIEYTDNPNAPNNYNVTPIDMASINGHSGIVKNLIGGSINYFTSNNDGTNQNLIHRPAAIGHTKFVKAVVECTVHPNTPDSFGRTPIHFAALFGHTKVVKALISCTENPNAPDKDGETPIYCAAENGHTEIVKLLIGCTDNPNAPDNRGRTPYEAAEYWSYVEVIELLKPLNDS